ncbi:hypothetical protein [Psychromonas sp. MME2]|uniref:hypothetical protein n=1 Tax=unclassified Psychromonas TaxID=2614957 RepID=UPI00339D0AF2
MHDHPLVQQIDNEIAHREARLSELQVQKISLTKALLKSTYEVADTLCRRLHIQKRERV